MSVNKVLLLAHLGRDPELKKTEKNHVCKFSVATSKKGKGENGELIDVTTWHEIVAFDKTAENAAKYLKKGSQCFIEGELSVSSWADKDTGKKRYRTEIIARSIQFIGGKSDTSQEQLAPPTIDNNEEIAF